MERLTIKNWRNLDPWETCGQDNYCKRGCHEQGGCTKGCIVPRIYARLAAYEGTGLEPEQVMELKSFTQGGIHKVDDGWKHVQDLLQAEKEARMVALPCKAGDTVYEISNNTDACNGCQHYEGIYGSGESWCMQIDDVDLRYYPNIAEKPLCEKQFMEVVAHKPEIDWIFTHRNDFGKTWFLTEEEANLALEKEGDSE